MSHSTYRRGPNNSRARSPITALNNEDASEREAFLDDPTAPPSAQAHDEIDSYEQVKRSAQPSPRPWSNMFRLRNRGAYQSNRTISFGETDSSRTRYPPNVVRNQKYNMVTFLPLVLYEQFKFFFNLYFLLVALSQLIPALKIGFLVTYIAPLSFVLCVTIGKEAIDDYERYKRDRESNSSPYTVIGSASSPIMQARAQHASTNTATVTHGSSISVQVPSSKLRVGDLVVLHKNQRVPADLILLKTYDTDASDDIVSSDPQFALDESTHQSTDAQGGGTCFVRTDQLDGETDWKLRIAVPLTQHMQEDELAQLGERGVVVAGPPSKDLHTFFGTLTVHPRLDSPLGSAGWDADNHDGQHPDHLALGPQSKAVPLSAENALWANTVLAAGRAVGIVVYTGRETRSVMNTSHPQTKVGLLDLEINGLSKILCAVTFALSVGLVALNGFHGEWWIYVFRFLILFSSIIPISLRVNLDMGKTVYGRQIMADKDISGTIVRTSTIPEELGRIEYLLTDKTGTLTKNEMEVKRLHMGTMTYGSDGMDEIRAQLESTFAETDKTLSPSLSSRPRTTRHWRDMGHRLHDLIVALALCHNVTPIMDEDGTVSYQASSPDEVALVRWTESVGLTLIARDQQTITLQTPTHGTLIYEVLEIFPFTSERKRMGIIVRERVTGEVTFYLKGADVVMSRIVSHNDWLDEECGNMAREGLRTLVIARQRLSAERLMMFERAYGAARLRMEQRDEHMAAVVSEQLEHNMELLGLTGVEDKLQDDVRTTLELLRNASIKVWMLTGDKIETATCIAISTKLVARNQYIHQVSKVTTDDAACDTLTFLRSKPDCCMVIDGDSLQFFLDNYRTAFVELATQLSVVVCCRCSPTQKAEVTRLIREYTKRQVCCIGDGGNDVSMIQAANVGIGIVGKEGKQASLAADFSILQFSYLGKLLLWHGRNSYQRSAKLSQFVIHRGLIISIMQAVFSSIFFFAPIALYQGWLMVGYATLYTMAPVFSLVLDRDVSEDIAMLYPELYKDLTKGRKLSAKTFTTWLMISVYQGGAIMIASLLLFETDFINIVGISFTALVLNELVMVALEITTWHIYMVISEICTLLIYCASILFLPEYFNLDFVLTYNFLWKTLIIVLVSSFPLYVIKAVHDRLSPPSYSKLSMT
ncbi:P-type phospholipid transporter [Malassezia cuniculi]|uniref:Phospholipid-transporting ATPase n=1 Tax=Malassezia cuniculi TaxID=948313 RepID=A0AAF0EWU6_9BASI|nr:P-type phospholipid transporter [Malassezia cuniculi]